MIHNTGYRIQYTKYKCNSFWSRCIVLPRKFGQSDGRTDGKTESWRSSAPNKFDLAIGAKHWMFSMVLKLLELKVFIVTFEIIYKEIYNLINKHYTKNHFIFSFEKQWSFFKILKIQKQCSNLYHKWTLNISKKQTVNTYIQEENCSPKNAYIYRYISLLVTNELHNQPLLAKNW